MSFDILTAVTTAYRLPTANAPGVPMLAAATPLPKFRAALAVNPLLLGLLILAAAALFAMWANWQAARSADWAVHSLQVRERSEQVLRRTREAQSGIRAFAATGNREFLQLLDGAEDQVLGQLAQLQALVGDRASQVRLIEQARPVLLRVFEQSKDIARLTQAGDTAAAIAIIADGRGRSTMDEATRLMEQIKFTEQTLLDERLGWARLTRIGSLVAMLLIIGVLVVIGSRQILSALGQARMLAADNASLEALVDQRTEDLQREKLRVEALLRDVNHRVGNNLAMVSALLNMQSRAEASEDVKRALANARERIHAIAAGQRRMRLNIDTDEIEARPYLEEAITAIREAQPTPNIAVELDLPDMVVSGRDALSYVVLINELVTNALKHAFPGDIAGRVRVAMIPATDSEPRRLIIEDDGVGQTSAEEAARGIGQVVVENLVRGLRARMTTGPARDDPDRPGHRVDIVFAAAE